MNGITLLSCGDILSYLWSVLLTNLVVPADNANGTWTGKNVETVVMTFLIQHIYGCINPFHAGTTFVHCKKMQNFENHLKSVMLVLIG